MTKESLSLGSGLPSSNNASVCHIESWKFVGKNSSHSGQQVLNGVCACTHEHAKTQTQTTLGGRPLLPVTSSAPVCSYIEMGIKRTLSRLFLGLEYHTWTMLKAEHWTHCEQLLVAQSLMKLCNPFSKAISPHGISPRDSSYKVPVPSTAPSFYLW